MVNPVHSDKISPEDIRECLERSGYLLESQIVRALEARDYFVEPNQVVHDSRTGKSRELDFVAEHYHYNHLQRGVSVKTHFVGEVVNNRFPFVLLTNRPSTPNEDFESHVKYICVPSSNRITDVVDLYESKSPPRELLFSQYCGLTRKTGSNKELMASHPDDTYSSLQKLSEYVESEIAKWDEIEDDYHRLFFWHPMLVLGGELIAVKTNSAGQNSFEAISSGFLEFNWHAGEERRTSVIEVVTLDSLYARMDQITSDDQDLQSKLYELHGARVGA